MGIDNRLRHAERKVSVSRYELMCPTCGAEFVVFGDAPLDLMVAEWLLATGSDSTHFHPDEALWDLAKHEHPAWDCIERRSGLPLSDPNVTGGPGLGPITVHESDEDAS